MHKESGKLRNGGSGFDLGLDLKSYSLFSEFHLI